jgi:trigger factor
MELIQNKEGLVATLTVKVSQEDYATQVEKGLRKARQTAQVRGFRPGNAPMSLIKKMYGQSLVFDEINKIVLEFIGNYEKENDGNLIGHVIPSGNQQLPDFGEYKDLELEYEAAFFPEFTYELNQDTELTYYNIIIDDKDIDEELNYYRTVYQPLEKVNEVSDDCIINVNIRLIKEGEEVENNANFLMSVVPDEYKPLFLGAKINDVINVEIRKVFTNETDLTGMLKLSKEELELQPESLPFTIIAISQKTPFKTEQEFYDMVTNGNKNIQSEEELRDYIREGIASNYESMSLDKFYIDSIKVLREKVNIGVPKDFVRKYVRFMQKENTEVLDEQLESFVNYFIDETEWNYIVRSLFEQNNIEITPEMIKDEAKIAVKELYGDYQYYDINDLVNYYLSKEEHLHDAASRAQRKQFADLLKKNVKVITVDVTQEEFSRICKNKQDNKEDKQDNKEEQA